MKYLVLYFSSIVLCQSLFSQEDTTFLKEIQIVEEVTVNAQGQSVFKEPNINLIDFYIGEQGKFLILKGKGNYFISRLSDDLSLQSSLLLTFKPERLIKDCLGNLQIISADSIYKLDQSSLEIGIYEPNPISFYDSYYADCKGETSHFLIYNFLMNSNQTSIFNAIDKDTHLQKMFYKAEDSIELIVANDWKDIIINDRYDFSSQMGETSIAALMTNRKKFQRLMFYNFVISKPDYNPLFILNNEVHIFDHYADSLIVFSGEKLNKIGSKPILYHKIKGWQKEILFDAKLSRFYTTFLFDGSLYLSELSQNDFSIVKSIKINKNAYPKRLIVYDGFLYYDYKTSAEDSFFKLFRQHI